MTGRPLVIGGAPGSGKTTMARALARLDEHAVCVETDRFFEFLTHMIDPSTPPADTQNRTVIAAYCRAARTYSDGGYAVYLEGVLGPWFVPLVSRELGEFDYVLLHAPLEVVQARVTARSAPVVSAELVARVHPQFERAVPDWLDHVIDTSSATVDEIAHEIQLRRQLGRCLVARPEGSAT